MNLLQSYEKIVRLFTHISYGVDADRKRLWNRRCTHNVIQLCADLKLTPKTLVDVGANNSQWAIWLKREWPDLKIESFEPHPAFQPSGNVHRIGLSNEPMRARLKTEQGATHVSDNGDTEIALARFDSLPLTVQRPAILKVDCETHTFKALDGFGKRLADFDIVVVEMWNYYPELPQFSYQQADIWRLMLEHNKPFCRVVDSEWTARSGIPYYDAAFYGHA